MTRNVTAVVTGVGGGVGQSIIKGLRLGMKRSDDFRYHIVGVDADPAAAGLYRSDKGYRVPVADDPGYIDSLCKITAEEDADVLIPGSDPEVLAVAEARKRIEDESGCRVLASPAESVSIGLDKWKTYLFLKNNGFATPDTGLGDEAEELVERTGFPVVVKPRTGSASRGLFIVTDQRELEYALEHAPSPIVQEYLTPVDWDDDLTRADLVRQVDEYSTEVIVNTEGKIVESIANWREMDRGVPSVAKVRPYEEIREASEAVVRSLDVLGPVNLQSRITDRGVTFFELNTRFTGSTAVRCVAGFNGPHSMVKNLVFGEELTAADLAFENIVEMRYNNEVYISEDDYEMMHDEGSIENGGVRFEYF
jgi:carbamoyl-phosphate synthase large subunit